MTVSQLPPPPPGKAGWPWTRETASFMPPSPADGGPKITIVTPSYNQADFLEETIRSVLLQGYPNLEYMVLDGGSTDRSVEIIRKYEKFMSFWVSEKDGGQTCAINRGLARATGEWIGWINSDDYYLPGAFSWVERTAQANPSASWLAAAVQFIGPEPGVRPQVPGTNLVEWLTHRAQLSQPGVFWKRELSHRAGPLLETMNYSFDWELWCRFVALGHAPLCDSRPVACFREHAGSKSCSLWDRFCTENIAIIALYRQKLGPDEQKLVDRRKLDLIATRLIHETDRNCRQRRAWRALANIWVTVSKHPRLLIRKRIPYIGSIRALRTALSFRLPPQSGRMQQL
jgi:glycosyltransferase involved in cell wall biosynthesis